jgi:hypothetical protein
MPQGQLVPFKIGEKEIGGQRVKFEADPDAAFQGPVGSMQSNLVCPLCDLPRIIAGEPPLEEHCINTRPGSFESTCKNGHPWADLTALKAAGARTVQRKFRPIVRPPEASGPTVEMKLQVPQAVKNRITARFPGNLVESITSMFDAMSNPGSFIVPAQEAKTISDKSGHKIGGAIELVGYVVGTYEEMQELKKKVDAAERNQPVAAPAPGAEPGKVVVQLSSGVAAQLQERATRSEVPLDVYVDGALDFALTNKWLD